MNKMKVKAAPGVKFPMEDNARKYITTEAVTVENTAYYRRAVQDGDLILVRDEPETTVTAEQDAVQVKAKKKEKQVDSDE
ncbi:DUF2635 domain-containing protein [Escherichia coli]|uniref:DUF2635 domain-containing protein n=1 Tax=Escherichia coli TaxID=562 RepID=UPI000DA5531F|nr:DUF2635 domain-containing protein [Escherichia coli]MEC9884012.1 DUF2635 domain-containing protein [Escherichia marmotae]MBI0697860.1 DUF2635 domain-containing protein [Escherichia coli]MDM4870017.1 DUF2635 domain-containing protein [Escherichia coli]MED0115015.1 DUF2635 domain-containing protein [Escherichia marmotae]MED8729551.1 DUF2635 domain-containing protein [Escherichia marmotae]